MRAGLCPCPRTASPTASWCVRPLPTCSRAVLCCVDTELVLTDVRIAVQCSPPNSQALRTCGWDLALQVYSDEEEVLLDSRGLLQGWASFQGNVDMDREGACSDRSRGWDVPSTSQGT